VFVHAQKNSVGGIKVENYAALKTLVVNEYDGRLVDVLDVKMW
jgi:hypothetical protein